MTRHICFLRHVPCRKLSADVRVGTLRSAVDCHALAGQMDSAGSAVGFPVPFLFVTRLLPTARADTLSATGGNSIPYISCIWHRCVVLSPHRRRPSRDKPPWLADIQQLCNIEGSHAAVLALEDQDRLEIILSCPVQFFGRNSAAFFVRKHAFPSPQRLDISNFIIHSLTHLSSKQAG